MASNNNIAATSMLKLIVRITILCIGHRLTAMANAQDPDAAYESLRRQVDVVVYEDLPYYG